MAMRYCRSLLLLCAFLLPAHPAKAVTIEGTEFAQYLPIDNEFAAQGALFSSTLAFVAFADNGGRLGIYGTDPAGLPPFGFIDFNAPIIVTFVDPADGTTASVVNGTVSAIWGDGGGDLDFLRLRAFDLADQLLGTVTGSGTGFQSISFGGTGIHKVIFDQQPGAPFSSDTFLDSLTFDLPVSAQAPEPSTLLLLCLGLGGWVVRRAHGARR